MKKHPHDYQPATSTLFSFFTRRFTGRLLNQLLVPVLLCFGSVLYWIVRADNTPQTPPFSQNWSNTGLITANDVWSGVPGIEGFRGDNLTGATGTDPQTLLAGDDPGVLDVNANQTDPNTFGTGGVAEFDIADDVVALTGSGTADAPYLRLYLNTTGLTNITVAYKVRDIDGSADDAQQQVALHYRVGNSGNFTNVPAAYIMDATIGGSATQVTNINVTLPAAVDSQPLVQLRIMTTNAVGNDEWVGIDDISITAGGGGGNSLSLSCTPATFAENAGAGVSTCTVTRTGSTAAALTVTLMSGDTTEATVPASVMIPMSATNTTFPVDAVDDMTVDGTQNVTITASAASFTNGTFQVMVTDNDVPTIIAINAIQGSGTTSPLSGTVMTQGVVTALRTNGFFMQTAVGSALDDGNANTSEGIFVFTSSAPPAAAVLGNIVTVTGTIADFITSSDICNTLTCTPEKVALTELTSPTVVMVSSGNTLPTPVTLTAADMVPGGSIEQLEKYESMRVTVASLLVVAPTEGSVTETSATSTSNGVFFGVIPNNTRPFREAGIEASEPIPPGSANTIPPVPRFDGNAERLRVDGDGQVGATVIDVAAGQTLGSLTGVLDFFFRNYTLLPDPGPVVAPFPPSASPLPDPAANEFTVASFNLERFFDTVNDGNGAPTLTATAFNNRLNKASLAIRNILRTPDILGVVEVENLSTLTALANKINADAGGSSPMYTAYLVEGNDVGGIDVGFLVKTALVVGATPRVFACPTCVVQEGKTTTYTNPNTGTQETLNDRPPLRLNAVVNHADGRTFAITVIVNHLRSLSGVNDPTVSGTGTEGARVRAKRQAQAVFLANLIQARQTADANERIIAVGDFNAFEVNDGYADVLATILGTPTPDNQTVVPGDGVDLITPDLTNLIVNAAASDRYSFCFNGNAQVLDHHLANGVLTPFLNSFRTGHLDADFPETFRNDSTRPERISDHDAPVSYFRFADPVLPPDLTLTKTHTGDFTIGLSGQYTITVSNAQAAGPTTGTITVTDTLPNNLTLASFSGTNWNCTGTGTANVSCTHPGPLAAGQALPALMLTVNVGAGTLTGTNSITNTATAATPGETVTNNNSASDPTTVAAANQPPVVTPGQPVNVQQGGPTVTNATLGTVSDDSTPPNLLTTMITTNPPNITVTNLSVAANGTITATLAANCQATVGANTLGIKFTDGGSLMNTGNFTINVTLNTAPTLVYPSPQSVANGGSLMVTPTTATDNGSITGYVVQSVSPVLTVAPTVNASGVVSITSAAPAGAHTITIRATDNCELMTDASFVLNVGCPTITVTPPGVTTGNLGVVFSQTFTQSGGAPPVTFMLNSGTLPTGLTLNADGSLTGTPTQGGTFPITVKVTDANTCVGTSTTYTLVINTPPTITAANGVTRQQGSPAAVGVTIGNVSDPDQPFGSVMVMATPLAGTGVTINKLTVDPKGIITADVAASCEATASTFTLKATDAQNAMTTTTLSIGVTANTAPTLVYPSPHNVANGGSLSVSPTTASDNGSITGYVVQSVSPALTTAPTVNASGAVSITNAAPAGAHVITIRATDNCNLTTDAQFTVNVGNICPSAFTVNNLGDTADANPGDRICADANGNCALRTAIEEANAIPICTPLTINFSVTGTINAASVLPNITHPNLTITGPGANLLTVSGVNSTHQMFTANNAGAVNLQISGLTITNGFASTGTNAGAIEFNSPGGVLTITLCTLTGNGGNNTGTGQIYSNLSGGIVLTGSTVSGNPIGSGIIIDRTPLTVTNSTISGNAGRGILAFASPPTVTVTLLNATIANNGIGGITFFDNGGSATLTTKNSMIANNVAQQIDAFAGLTITSQGNNLCSDATLTPQAAGDLINTNPLLAPLGNYGGPTQTHALLCNSPAINAGNNSGAPATDQRGIGRPQAATTDIGAFENNLNLAPMTLPNGTAGAAYNQSITASGGTANYTFMLLSGTPPAGLTLNQNGSVTGTPTAAGTSTFTVKATDANGFAGVCPISLQVVCPALVVQPLTLNPGMQGTTYSQQFTVTGGSGNYSFAAANPTLLPPGLTLSSAGLLSGTPSQPGTFMFTVNVTDTTTGCTGGRTYTLGVTCPTILITPETLPDGVVGTAYDATLTAKGGTALYTFSLAIGSTLPPNLVLNPSGTINGTPFASGTFTFTVNVSDSLKCTGSRTYTISMTCENITITPATLPPGRAGQVYNQTLLAKGGKPLHTFLVTAGALPMGLSLSSAGELAGTPTVSGTFNFTVTATDVNKCTGVQAYALVIGPPCPTITVNPATLANGFVGTNYNQTVSAQPAATYNFTLASGSLPNGLQLNATTGVLAGLPTTTGSFTFTIRATDTATQCHGTRQYTVIVSGNGLMFYPLPRPVRLLDTRANQGMCDNVNAPIPAGTALTTLARTTCENITIPATAQAIVGNITALNGGTQFGFLTIYPTGQMLPLAANMIYAPGDIISNNFTVGLSADGRFDIFGERTIDVVVDISGYFAPPTTGLFYHPLPRPVRLLDTRPGGNCDNVATPIPAGTSITTQARIVCEGITIPAGAQAIVGNATVVNGSGQLGFATLYPSGVTLPTAANIVYFPGQIISNAFTVGLSAGGQFDLFGERTIDVVIDVAGYYSSELVDVNGPGLLFSPLSRPLRIMDTRPEQSLCDNVGAPIAAMTSLAVPARLSCDGITIPNTAQTVIGNFTALNQTAQAGFATLFPEHVTLPLAANIIYFPQQILSNAFTVGLNPANGQFRIFGERTIHAVVDVSGYFAP